MPKKYFAHRPPPTPTLNLDPFPLQFCFLFTDCYDIFFKSVILILQGDEQIICCGDERPPPIKPTPSLPPIGNGDEDDITFL